MTTAESVQLELVLAPLVRPTYESSMSIQERFDLFHAANPWVYDAFVELTTDELTRSNRVGIGMLTEVIRWHYGRQTHGDTFKINNDFRSRYVRLMIANHPEWDSAFETRELRAA